MKPTFVWEEGPMIVREFAHSAVVTCAPETSIAQVARIMDREKVGSVVVVEEHGNVAGIVTDRDLAIQGLGREIDPGAPVTAVMTRGVATIEQDADVFDAAERMAKVRCRRLPVVDDQGYPVGIVTLDDLLMLFDQETDHLIHAVAAEAERPTAV